MGGFRERRHGDDAVSIGRILLQMTEQRVGERGGIRHLAIAYMYDSLTIGQRRARHAEANREHLTIGLARVLPVLQQALQPLEPARPLA